MPSQDEKGRNADLPKLLRAIANGSTARKWRGDIIFNAAADEIELLKHDIERYVQISSDQATEIERLRAECFNLASYTCTHRSGDDHGNPFCLMQQKAI